MCIFMREIMVGEEKRSKDRRMEKCFFPPRREGGMMMTCTTTE